MSDRMFQKVTIGGDPGKHRAIFMAMLEELQSSDDETEEEAESVSICDSEASTGTFDDLKRFLREIGLPYNHYTEAKWEYDGTIAYWRPGMDYERWTHCTQSECQTIPVGDLEEALASGLTLAEVLPQVTIPVLPDWVKAD